MVMQKNYKQKFSKMLVVTSQNNIPFYVKQGFDKYQKTIKNYFIDNYDEKIIDGDLVCTDMYYYSKDLKKTKKISLQKKDQIAIQKIYQRIIDIQFNKSNTFV